MGPVLIVAVVLLVVMAVGWKFGDKLTGPSVKPQEPAVTEAAKPTETQPVQPQQQQTPAPKPPEPQADPNKEIMDRRAKIDRSNGAKDTMLLTVFYGDGLKNGESLQPVQVRIPATAALIRATVDQLLVSPGELKLYSNIPAGTKVRGVNMDAKTGVATVDLSAEGGTVQGSTAAHTMMASLVYSLTSLKDVKAVQLWIMGKPAMLHGIEWSKPISRADMDARAYFKVEPLIKYAP